MITVWDKEYRCWADWFPPTTPNEPHGTLCTLNGVMWITPQVFWLPPVGFDWDGELKPIGELDHGR